MTISKDLLLAILALDSYNRGFGAGIAGLSDDKGTQIGPASINTRIGDIEDFADEAEAADFYAIAYEVDGDHVKGMEGKTTVIAYRGTEFAPKTDRATDVAQGWALAA